MERHMIKRQRILYGVAALVLVLGCIAAAGLIIPSLTSYPGLIQRAFYGRLHKIEVPGAADIDLSREGAYGVYYEGFEGAYVHAELPPNLDCSLTSKTTGDDIPLVPIYVPTNRYSTHEGSRLGVLIYSMAINEPGPHSVSCDYPDGRRGPKLMLAIGPSYFYEFLHVVWIMGRSILQGAGVLCGALVLSLILAVVALVQTREREAG